VTIAEIPLFRDVTAVQSYTIEEDGGKFLDKSPKAVGQSEYDDYTVLIIIHFTRNDMKSAGGIGQLFRRLAFRGSGITPAAI